MITYTNTEKATIEKAKQLLAAQIPGIPIWVRWYRTYDNPHGGGAFGKSKEYCTCELVGVTAKRIKLREIAGGVSAVDPNHCFFADRVHL